MLHRLCCVALALSLSLPAAVKKIYVEERTDVLNGREFGAVGPYERITAKAHFAVDPKLPGNRLIRDIDLAPKNAQGMVEFSADIYVLKPRQPKQGNGTILYEVSNRGRKGLLDMFSYAAASNDPRTEADFGDAWLLEQGYTLVWLGWQFDVPEEPNLLHIEVPKAEGVSGIVRSEFVPSKPETRFSLGDRAMKPYPVTDPDAPGTQLTVRDTRDGARRVIPRSQWKFRDNIGVEVPGGMQPGKLYEVVYTSKNPALVGLGMAATRDLISFLKYGGDGTIFLSDQRSVLKRAISLGNSQSGRFLRTYLYMGFNADEKSRKVFDGVWANVAGGGRGSFNHRFAQPSRDGHRLTNTYYPSDMFPFADLRTMDPETKAVDGLLSKAIEANVAPKIFYTNGSYEYWGRGASLIHTSPDARKDDGPSADTRIYFIAGSQHGPGRFPPAGPVETAYSQNPNDFRPILRALLARMNDWVTNGKEPPPSRHPRIANNDLVPFQSVHFPAIPGVRLPVAAYQPDRMDFGPEFLEKGIITIDPPKVGKPYPTLQPQVDQDGNETSGIRMPDVSVPLGTYAGWNLRAQSIGGSNELFSLVGAFHPFPATAKDRAAKHDPRLSIAERYTGPDDYLAKIRQACAALLTDGFLLPGDEVRILRQATDRWGALASQ